MRTLSAFIPAVAGLPLATTAPATGGADRVRAGARPAAGQNLGTGVARNLARLSVVLGICGLAYGAAGGSVAAGAEQFRYHFVPLDPTVPPGLGAFNPATITENGAIYGTAIACDANGCKYTAAVYRNGITTG